MVRRGFDVLNAKDLCRGETDERALAIAGESRRLLITEDRGFGELAVRHQQPARGIIVLLLDALPAGERERYAVDRIVEVIERAENNLVIIEPGRVRIRPIPSSQSGGAQ